MIFDKLFNRDKVATEQVNPDKNNLPFLSIRIKPGMKLFQINVKTGEVNEAEYKETVSAFGSNEIHKSLVVKEGFRYIPAINRKNAIRKALRRTV